MSHKRIFEPEGIQREPGQAAVSLADRAEVYVYHDDNIALAVNVALAAERPLLIRGEPGCGKSSLARDVARQMGWRYYEHVVTSRMQAQDLLYRFDTVRRLADAQTNERLAKERYVSPSALFWAFDPEQAARLAPAKSVADLSQPAVVLIDEIDKADPDVPNDLLIPIGSLEFPITELDLVVKAEQERLPFIVFTSNDERELPAAFLRRCIILEIELPRRNQLLEIVRAHFPALGQPLVYHLLRAFLTFRDIAETQKVRPPGIAELIDAARVCQSLLGSRERESQDWLIELAMWKHGGDPTGRRREKIEREREADASGSA